MIDKSSASPRAWIEVRVPTHHQVEDASMNYLFELGSDGCQQLENAVVAYFADQNNVDDLKRNIARYLAELTALGFEPLREPVECKTIANQDWHGNWKKHFKPIVVSERILVKPTWTDFKSEANPQVVIEIDPKQAFGTGSHPTTRMALRFLEKYLSEGDRVLDVGTGSGILTIAAMKLGAGRVVAFDNDPIAIEAAMENCAQNSLVSKPRLFVGELTALKNSAPCFDFILANLNRKVIVRALPELNRHLSVSGHIVITGILQQESSQLSDRLDHVPSLRIVETHSIEDWLGLVLRKELPR